jgi:hypothetical protein
MTDAASTPPAEKIGRGVFLALIALPLGVAAWLLIWSWGYMASIVALGVAILAAFLYRLGSGGRIGKIGALAVTLITVGTIAIAFYAGLVLDAATAIGAEVGLGWFDVATHPLFGETFSAMLADNADSIFGDVVLAVIFTALGAGGVLFSVFRESKALAAAESGTTPLEAPAAPSAQQVDPTPEPDAVK